ncbi:recombinase family protein [Virgibacillus dokdonensis]|uniref:recombinase family protein n=1 Tax=Virgibacillus dokdonensis TaxID=302167 RepID=UPI0015F27F41|nr:recombinase family protein [Virgibacillus dokdonensis]
MRVAIYVRVSTEEQAKEGYSIEGQKQHLKHYCIDNGWEVVGIYADEGLSAKDMNRPQLQALLKQIEQGDIDHVLVYKLDRITRSVPDLYKIKETMDKHNCSIKSATESIDTSTPMGRLVITMSAGMAQWERETIGERISFGLKEKVRQGYWSLNTPPYGYDYDKETKSLIANEQEVNTLRMIHKLYRKWGMAKIARYLNSNNIPTKTMAKWHATSIRQILTGVSQIGKIYWRGEIYEGKHKAIISKEEFEHTQRLIKRRSNEQPRSVSSQYIFSTKLICPHCGRYLNGYYTTTSGKTYYNYRCKGKQEGICTKGKSVSQINAEKAFIEYLGDYSNRDKITDVANKAENELSRNELKNDVESLTKQLKKLENKKKKWQYAWAEDIMPYEDFKKRMEEANKEEKEIKEQLKEYKDNEEETEKLSMHELSEVLFDIKENWYSLNNEEKKMLVSDVIDKIHYDYNGSRIVIKSVIFM